MNATPSLDALLVYVEACGFGWPITRTPQIGLYYVAQAAVDAGYHVRIDNLSASDHVADRISRLLVDHDCPRLGLYVDQDNLWDLRRVLPHVKARRPDVEIVLGGPQMTNDPVRTLERLPEAACGVLGEGEVTFTELLGLPAWTPDHLHTVAGVALPTANGHPDSKGTAFTPPRPLIQDLDSIPMPRYRELNLDLEAPTPVGMITGRGCHGHCAFCSEGIITDRKRLRLHTVERALAEFDRLVEEEGRSYIAIYDDTFVADPRRLREFCRRIKAKYHGEVKWYCEARADTLARHTDLLPMMIDAGLLRVQLGGESGSQRILDAYRKGTTLEQVYQVVEAAREHDLLSMYYNFIIGGAFETQATYEQTRDFALELLAMAPGCVGVGASFYTPYPGTPMAQDPVAFGLEVLDPEVVTGRGDNHVFCRTDALSRYEILALGQDFDRHVAAAMQQLRATLPRERVKRLFQAYHTWEVQTEWYSALAEDPAAAAYHKAIFQGTVHPWCAAARSSGAVTPLRQISLAASLDGRYVLRLMDGTARVLDPLEGMLLDLSAGKLSLADIMDIVHGQMPDIPTGTLTAAVAERYQRFDDAYWVVWRVEDGDGEQAA